MPLSLSRRAFVLSGSALALARPGFAQGGTLHEIAMLNIHPEDRSQRMVFLPRLLRIAPGDSVRFLATDRNHNSASIEGMLPQGATPWRGGLNEEIEVTLDIPGVYGYACTPHYSMGMVGMIIVEGEGMADNASAARETRHRGRANRAFDEIWAEVDEQGLLTL